MPGNFNYSRKFISALQSARMKLDYSPLNYSIDFKVFIKGVHLTVLAKVVARASKTFMAVSISLLLCSSVQATIASDNNEHSWVLQLGYFASLENASTFKQSLSDAGFEVQVVSTGLPGDQRFRVISGQAAQEVGLEDLREAIENRTGNLGIIRPSPFASVKAENVFDEPKLKYLVAQAVSVPSAGSSVSRSSGYDPMLNRSPQEETESSIGFTAAGMQIVPTLGLSIGYDDNITASSTHQISSLFYQISPSVRVELPSDHTVLALIAALEMVRHQDSPIDDRDSWYVRGQWVWDISTRQNLNLFAEYGEGVDQRGQGRRQGDLGLISLELDQWERWDYGGNWDYGSVGSRGRLTLQLGATDLTYTNNRKGPVTGASATRALDRDWQYFGGTFYWRVAPKSSLLVDYKYTDINYKLSSGSDSSEQSWMFGATWDASARTSGEVKYGNLKKDFNDPAISSYNGPTWVASVNWRPRTYSVFTLTGTRNTQEPDGGGDYVLRQDISLSWVHDWATRFGTTVDVGFGQDEYRPTERKDDLFYWGLGARYTFNQHFRLGASVNSYDRSSDFAEYDYRQMMYMLTLEATY